MKAAEEWASSRLGHAFRDPGLLEQALTHRSAGSVHNERLEFLGDAVLGLVAAELLYERRPDATEGILTRLRARLVRRETLARIARDLDLGLQIQLGSGELRTGGHQRQSILANTLEALLGAVYLDGGLAAAGNVIRGLLAADIEALPDDDDLRDPKTRLQELIQGRGLPLPVYEVTSVSGAAHDQCFAVTCRHPGLGLDVAGTGSSRRGAEQDAAARALKELASRE
jgi:ribonuclease-3